MQPNAYLAQNGYPTGTMSNGVGPYIASNGTNQGFGAIGTNGLPNPALYATPNVPYTGGFTQPQYISAFGNAVNPPLLASNATVPSPVARPTMVDGTKRTIGSE